MPEFILILAGIIIVVGLIYGAYRFYNFMEIEIATRKDLLGKLKVVKKEHNSEIAKAKADRLARKREKIKEMEEVRLAGVLKKAQERHDAKLEKEHAKIEQQKHLDELRHQIKKPVITPVVQPIVEPQSEITTEILVTENQEA